MRTLRRRSELDAFVAASPVQRGPIARAVSAAAQALPAGSDVLDAGAGDAPYRALFTHCSYVTQDWPESVHGKAGTADIVADLHELPVDDERFDFVLCTEVLEHVAEPARVLAQLRRVLRPGGVVLITVPFVGELHEDPHDYWRFTRYGLDRLLRDAGFTAPAIEPLTGYWSTLTHVLRHSSLATRPMGGRARPLSRALTFTLLCASAVLQRAVTALDRTDQRHGLPIGWSVRATRAAT